MKHIIEELSPSVATTTAQTQMMGKPVLTTDCRILNLDSGFKHKHLCSGPTFSAGTACAFRCEYCFVETQVGTKPFVTNVLAGRKFQDVVIRRNNPVEKLRSELRKRSGELKFKNATGVIYGSPLVDIAATKELTRETIEIVQVLLNDTGWDVRLLSKSPLITKIAESLSEEQKHRVIFGLSTGTLDDKLARAIEPTCPAASKRCESLRWLQDNGFRMFAMLCPILPQPMDQFLEQVEQLVRPEKCEHVWAEVINVRGQSMQKTLAALQDAGLHQAAADLSAVSGEGSKPAWEQYARNTFLGLVSVIPKNAAEPKLRFLQYVTKGTVGWWKQQSINGAVVLQDSTKADTSAKKTSVKTLEMSDGPGTKTSPVDNATPDLEPGKFPVHALNPVMREMVENMADVHRVPVELPAMCAVSIVSGALGKAFTLTGAVNGKDACHGNLYVIAAVSKSGGKGSVAGALVRPLLDASTELATDFKIKQLPGLKMEKAILEKRAKVLVNELATGKTGLGQDGKLIVEMKMMETRDELEQAHARLDVITPLIEALPTYWLGNATSEAMEFQFKRNNPGLFCYSAEAGAVVRVMLGKYSRGQAADLDLYLSGYTVEDWRSDRIGRGVCQIKPCLSMLLMVQPSILREFLGNEEAFDRGMTARPLMFVVETEPLEDDGLVREINSGTVTAWNQLIRGLLKRRESIAGNPHCITCTPEAREIFRQFYNESVRLRRGEFSDIEAELGRWRENAIRLAIGQCVADNLEARELTGEQAARAVEIMRWCARSALKATNVPRTQKRTERADVLQAILADKSGCKETLRNLEKSHGFEPGEIHTIAIQQYPDRFTMERVKTGGRPSKVLRLTSLVT